MSEHLAGSCVRINLDNVYVNNTFKRKSIIPTPNNLASQSGLAKFAAFLMPQGPADGFRRPTEPQRFISTTRALDDFIGCRNFGGQGKPGITKPNRRQFSEAFGRSSNLVVIPNIQPGIFWDSGGSYNMLSLERHSKYLCLEKGPL